MKRYFKAYTSAIYAYFDDEIHLVSITNNNINYYSSTLELYDLEMYVRCGQATELNENEIALLEL
jgi:hypothetical protein